MTAAKNTIVSWLLNFRIPMFVKSGVKVIVLQKQYFFVTQYILNPYGQAFFNHAKFMPNTLFSLMVVCPSNLVYG